MEIGLTLPGFVERSQAIASLPSLALLALASMTLDTFDISYPEVPDIHALDELPPCDVAAISSYSAHAPRTASLTTARVSIRIPVYYVI